MSTELASQIIKSLVVEFDNGNQFRIGEGLFKGRLVLVEREKSMREPDTPSFVHTMPKYKLEIEVEFMPEELFSKSVQIKKVGEVL